jgi:peptidyl-prolyl cis-trans isomerase C
VLYRSARDTGVDASDTRLRERLLAFPRAETVERRHLTQLMRLAAERLGPEDMPTEAEIAPYLAAHADAFAEPAALSITHVYFSADRRGPALAGDADATAETLRLGTVGPADAPGLGDAFPGGSTLGGVSRGQVERVFGPDFADAVWSTPAHTWVGPVSSAYGLHLVWISERVPGRTPPLAAVHARVLQTMLHERRAARLRSLHALYAARAEPADPDR